MSTKSLYDWLEVAPWARPEVIHAAYRAMAKIYRPDLPGGDDSAGKSLIEAYSTLSDPEKRRGYDSAREELEGKIIGEYRVLDLISDEGGFGSGSGFWRIVY